MIDRLDALEVWKVEQPPAGFADAVLRAIEVPARVPARSRRRLALTLGVSALLAVAAVLVLREVEPNASRGELEADTRRTVTIPERATVVAEAGTRLAWTTDDAGAVHVAQRSGSAFYRVDEGGDFDVVTPAGIVSVSGTCFNVEVEEMNENSKRSWWRGAALGSAAAAAVIVTVYEGEVVLANDNGRVDVGAGEHARARVGSGPEIDEPGESDESGTIAALRTQTRAQERELSRLRHELAARSGAPTVDEDASAEADEDPSTALANPLLATLDEGFSYFDPTPEALEKMADCGVVAWDQPPVWDESASFDPQWRDAVDLGDAEAEALDTALSDFRERSVAELRRYYVELGGDTQAVESFTAQELLQLVYGRLDGEELAATREAIARERAGREEVPEDASVAGRFMRWEAQLGDAFEDELGHRLGPERAHELRAADEGWGNKRLTYTNLCVEK
jgi:hypothetical protein